MKKRNLILTAGLAVVLGTGAAAVSFGGARQIIRIEEGTREVTDMEDGQIVDIEGGQDQVQQLQPNRMWGTVTETHEGGFTFNSQTENGYQGDVVVHIDPEQTLVIDSVTGFPAAQDQIAAGNMIYVYAGPAMTMSLPPQTTAAVVFVNVPEDGSAPLYVTAADSLQDNGQGGYTLTTADGQSIIIPADCPIIPYLTRQMVTLQDITAGRKCMIWLDASGAASNIVLFNQ
ncbi:MAG TPA: hypothetical protein IAA51_08385 [Candidatus Cottocaccamicrobium excrementipullorum]|nr:hypothetical protein [Candidatus Cottocaccamicrobium excrementipullorum]